MKPTQILSIAIAVGVIAMGIGVYLVVARPTYNSNSGVCQGTQTVVQLTEDGNVTIISSIPSYTTTTASAGTVGQTTVRTSVDKALTGPDIANSEGMTCTYTK